MRRARVRRTAAASRPNATFFATDEMRKQRVVLEHHADAALLGRHLQSRLRHDAFRQQDLPALHRLEAREAAQHRRLAAAGGSEQAADAPRLQHEVHAADDAMLAIRMLQRSDADGSGHRARLARQPRRDGGAFCAVSPVAPRLRSVLIFVGHRVADEHLRLRRRCVVGVALALGHERLRLLERACEACRSSPGPCSKNASPKNAGGVRPPQPNDVRSSRASVTIIVYSSFSGAMKPPE